MKKFKNYFSILLIVIIVSSCNKNETEDNEGYESYRFELWKSLLDNNYNFNFVGTQYDDGNYPNHLGQAFDRYHEGIGGIETDGVLNNLNDVLSDIPKPDVVLLCIGGNDLLDGGEEPPEPLENINEIIDLLQEENPNITIFLEQIAPAREDIMTTEFKNKLETFNDGIEAIASSQTDTNSVVIYVDMFTNFSEDFFADEVHYNKLGAKFVSDQYLNTIQNTLDNTSNLNILTLGDSRVEGNRQ